MQQGKCSSRPVSHFATFETRLSEEISCLKSAMSKIDALSNDPEHQWARGIYEKIIQRRETVLRGLTEFRSPLEAYTSRRAS